MSFHLRGLVLTRTELSLRASDSDAPVLAPLQFFGRAGLVRNLAGRCSHGQSVLLYGGPKLGKTTLLLQLRWRLTRQKTPSWTPPAVQYLDLRDPDIRRTFLAGEWDGTHVLLLDNCDALLAKELQLAVRIEQSAPQGPGSQAIVWAGEREWYEYAKRTKTRLHLQLAPLAVLLTSDARALVAPSLQPPQIEAALRYGGTHPYVLNALRGQFLAAQPNTGTKVVLRAAAKQLEPFFEACAKAMEPRERKLFDWLAKKDQPVNPKEAAHALQDSSVKQTADTLCYLGLISRWNLEKGAMLNAPCKLFNKWYLGTHRG